MTENWQVVFQISTQNEAELHLPSTFSNLEQHLYHSVEFNEPIITKQDETACYGYNYSRIQPL